METRFYKVTFNNGGKLETIYLKSSLFIKDMLSHYLLNQWLITFEKSYTPMNHVYFACNSAMTESFKISVNTLYADEVLELESQGAKFKTVIKFS